MKRLIIYGFALFLLNGCVPDPFGTSVKQVAPTATDYRGEMGRPTHPLSFVTGPEPPSITTLPRLHESLVGYLPDCRVRRDPDYLFALHRFRALYPDMDLNEPVSRQFMFAYLAQDPFPSMITLSPETYLHFQLDNDIFNYTDRFYTNGIQISLITPALRYNPLTAVLVPYWSRGINFYGLTLVQNMYTPSTTKIGGILQGDRPYASYLYLGTSKVTNDPVTKVRLTSELQVGLLGPSSMGEYVQRTFHNAVPTNNEPLGWEFQIQDDLLLNYMVRIEKEMVSKPGLDMLIYGSGSLGTVYTNLGGGTFIRSGWFNPYFMNLFFSKRSLNGIRHARNFQFYFFMDLSGKVIGYDATLQGGLFNKSSPYTIPADNVNRLMFVGTGGIVVSYGGFQLRGEQFIQSPEFVNGWWHKWLSIGLTFSF